MPIQVCFSRKKVLEIARRIHRANEGADVGVLYGAMPPPARAKVMRETCHAVLDELGVRNDPLLAVAMELEKIALEDEYFVEKKLYPNIDFYSGIILSAIGFPTTMFTALFALARTVGWVAQYNEMISDPGQVIGRPRQLYTGPTQRDYVPVDKR